jgi:malonate transporter
MLIVFLDAVLPVFAVVVAGYVFGRTGLFDFQAATAINRFVFYFALPVLLFRLIATAPFENFNWGMSQAFLLVELTTYLAGYLISRHVFHRSTTESLLLGMTTAFANQVFFVLPIARQLYGDAGALPVVAVSTVDVVVLLGGTIFILQLIGTGSDKTLSHRLFRTFVRVPPVFGIAAGAVANLIGLPVTGGLEFFTRFVGETAAPCSLFGLGLILVARRDKSGPALPAVMIGLKLLLMPFVGWIFLYLVFRVPPDWANPAMLVAAGPAGAMPYVLALQYKVPVASIARIIMVSTVISLITVTLMTQIG